MIGDSHLSIIRINLTINNHASYLSYHAGNFTGIYQNIIIIIIIIIIEYILIISLV